MKELRSAIKEAVPSAEVEGQFSHVSLCSNDKFLPQPKLVEGVLLK